MNAHAKTVVRPKHFIDIADLETATLASIVAEARRRKSARQGLPHGAPDEDRPLDGRVLAMIFDKHSTRTRISFDIAMRQLGGTTMMMSGAELQLAREETIADTARVLSRYLEAVMIRLLDHEIVQDLADNASIPVINGLTKFSHPCQVLADILTFEEKKGPVAGKTVAWTGDANNVLTSWVHAAARFSFCLRIATPRDFAPHETVKEWARKAGAAIEFGYDPERAVADADCVVTDAWVSMGDEDAVKRHHLLRAYQVNETLMARAARDAIFMHCLPAHRGEEVTDGVIDGPQSAVFDEAENRLHVQKAILLWCLT